MSTKQQLAEILEQHDGEYVSGSYLAAQLNLTRAAVGDDLLKSLFESFFISP